MSQARQILNNSSTRRNTRVFDSATTTNATPTVVGSVPLGQGIASFFQVEMFCTTSTFSAAQYFIVRAGFRRPVGGNVIRATSGGGAGLPYLQTDGDFTPKKPTVDLVANTVTQTIDIVATGIAATTIKWYFGSLSIQNLT